MYGTVFTGIHSIFNTMLAVRTPRLSVYDHAPTEPSFADTAAKTLLLVVVTSRSLATNLGAVTLARVKGLPMSCFYQSVTPTSLS